MKINKLILPVFILISFFLLSPQAQASVQGFTSGTTYTNSSDRPFWVDGYITSASASGYGFAHNPSGQFHLMLCINGDTMVCDSLQDSVSGSGLIYSDTISVSAGSSKSYNNGFLGIGFVSNMDYVTYSIDVHEAFDVPAPDPDPTPLPEPTGIVRCSPTTQAVAVGEAVNITSSGSEVGTYSWSAPGGDPSSDNDSNFNTTYATEGYHLVTVTGGAGEGTASCAVQVGASGGGGGGGGGPDPNEACELVCEDPTLPEPPPDCRYEKVSSNGCGAGHTRDLFGLYCSLACPYTEVPMGDPPACTPAANLNSGSIISGGFPYASDEGPERAFDGMARAPHSSWRGVASQTSCNDQGCETTTVPEVYIGRSFGTPLSLRRINATNAIAAADFNGPVQYSDNGSSWTNTGKSFNFNRLQQGVYTVDLPVSLGLHRYWRVLKVDAGQFQSISELQFYDCPVPPPFDYSLSNNGTSSVIKNSSGNAITTNIITRTYLTGTTEPVSLTVSGQPAVVNVSISPSSCNPTCTSTITFTVPSNTPVGTYNITVTGQPLGKTTSFSLVITGAPITLTCVGNPATAVLGQEVTWRGTITSGGVPPYTYFWSGTNIPTSPAPVTNPYNKVYGSIGQKTAQLTVTDAEGTQSTCNPATVQVKFNPNFEEF